MQRARRRLLVLMAVTLAVTSFPAVAQVVVATAPTGVVPVLVAVNPVTNKIYVANYCGSASYCLSKGTVTVLDGATNNTITVTVGYYPDALAVNPATNKIYVANYCGNDITCESSGTVTVIDGATNNTSSIPVGYFPYALAVNPATNKIYLANYCGNDVNCGSPGTATVIDANNNNSTATVAVGDFPEDVAVDSVTNQIYVANRCGTDISCSSAGTVTVIDGASNNTTAVNVGFSPDFVVLNSTTNQIYVANFCGNDPTCASAGTVTVIDANHNNSTATVNVQYSPGGMAVNSATNQIYLANTCGNDPSCSIPGTVTVINGANNNTTTVDVAFDPFFVDIDSAANKIYVTNYCGNDFICESPGTLTVIDGTSQATFPIAAGDAPDAVAVNSSTHSIYVPNLTDNTVSVIGGNTTLQLVNVTPCRLVDTRQSGGPIEGGNTQTFNLPQLAQTGCTNLNLSSAASYSLNVTLIPAQGPVEYLTIWPASQSQPDVSTMNSDGRIKANAAIVSAGVSGAISVYVTNTTDLVLDIDGYFTPASSSTLAFYPLTPCRVADTRNSQEPDGLGPPSLSGGMPRNFPVLNATTCFPPGVTPVAYSLNFTAVPQGPLGYLTVWQTGQSQPNVSTLNAPTGAVTANAAIVPAGTNGAISAFAYNNTNLVIDVNGYFAPPGQGGLSLYPAVPCRVLDTRVPTGSGPFSGTMSPPVDVLGSPCGVPSQAQAYTLNATVVPVGSLGYLTLWPDQQQQPGVSTLNAYDGAITSNMAIVPAGTTNGKIDAFAYGTTDLILDISSFLAP